MKNLVFVRSRQCDFIAAPVRRFWSMLVGVSILAGVVNAANNVAAPSIEPFEAAYSNAPIVVRGKIAQFDTKSGAVLDIDEVLKGHVAASTITLGGTRGFPFLAAVGTPAVVFLETVAEGHGSLWRGPTSGGLIWNAPSLFDQIAHAAADAERCLSAKDSRTRLSAAYFLAHSATSKASRESIVEALLWGLDQPALDANAAAYSGLVALGVDLEQAGSYHPGYKLEVKQRFAHQLRAQLAN